MNGRNGKIIYKGGKTGPEYLLVSDAAGDRDV